MNYPASLNPFLDDDEDDTASFYSAESPPSYPPPPPPHHHQYSMAHLKLPVFWADAPVAWFAAVEAQFQLRRVVRRRAVLQRHRRLGQDDSEEGGAPGGDSGHQAAVH